ncbi:hypothetical protein Mal35_55090 [Gimesia maris]|uniref:hypothetical protein n=1 Tax=Gimesia maris TaxID=122 RepID=UPI00118A79B0|nr:hypothetical protein [Gimesia maris]QDT82018.1 hypothetical protein Mal35_55090 [Gimesia maris]
MTDGLLRVTKYSLKSLRWKSLILTAVLVLPSLGLRFLIFLDKITSDQLSPLYYRQSPFYTGFPSGIHFTFLYLTGIAFLIFCLMELPFKQKLMSRMPVSTAGIVSGLNVSLLIILCIVSLISNGAFRLFLFDADGFRKYWPVVGPTLFFMTSIVVVQWIYWDIQRVGFARLLFWISFVLGMCCWFRSRYYLDVYDIYSIAPWSNMTWPEFFTMMTVFVTAWIGAIRSCSLVRSGAAVPSRMWEHFWQGAGRLGHMTWGADPGKSDSVASAFARLYWRGSCSSLMLFGVLLGTSLFVASLFSADSLDEIGATAFLFLYLFSFLFAILLADSYRKVYLLGVPLSDRDMASVLIGALLKLVVLSVSSVLLLGLGGGSLISLLVQGAEATRMLWPWAILLAWNIGWFHGYALLLLAAWIMVSNMISLVWSPYQKLMDFSLIVFFLLPFPALFIYEHLDQLSSGIIDDVLFLSISALIWSVTIIAYMRAYGAGLISSRAGWLAALFCLVVPALYWDFWETNGLSLRVLLSSLLILAVTPYATIPLGVSRSRHC